MLVKSPLNYVGGKFKLLPQIVPLLPSNIYNFYDLFGGGFNVGLNVTAARVVYCDIETEVVNLMRYFRDTPTDEILAGIEDKIDKYGLTRTSVYGYDYYGCSSSDGVAKINKEGYTRMRADYNQGEKSPLMFYMLVLFAFSNQIRFNKKGEFNMPVNKRDFNDKLKKNLIAFSDLIKVRNVEVYNSDFRELNINSLGSQDFVYLDPPYLITNAAYNEQGAWTEKDEQDLFEFMDNLHSRGIKFGLSNVIENKGKVNELLLDWSKKYNVHNLNHSYGNSNYQSKDKSKSSTREVLITNY